MCVCHLPDLLYPKSWVAGTRLVASQSPVLGGTPGFAAPPSYTPCLHVFLTMFQHGERAKPINIG